MNQELHDVIIVGAGPAGLTAALYASRAGLSTLVLEAGFPGGKMLSTSDIENWPGCTRTTGTELAMQMTEHAFQFGAQQLTAQVTGIEKEGKIFRLTDSDGKNYLAKAVILATGSKERKLGIPGEADYAGMGVSYCAVCDGAFFRGKKVAVIGGGNSAFEEACYLTNFAQEVHIFLRRDVARADAVPVRHAEENPKVFIHYNKLPQEILGNGMQVTAVRFQDRLTKEEMVFEVDGVFPFVGLDPVTDYIKLPVLNDKGFVEAKVDMSTELPGLYTAGDCRNTPLRQIVTAAGDGSVAAQAVNAYLSTWEELEG